jgi:hypothetical protein
MVRVCDGKTLPKGEPNAVYLLRPFGNAVHEIWNTADPAHPQLVTRVVENLKGTHKAGGNATPVLPISSPACRTGGGRG